MKIYRLLIALMFLSGISSCDKWLDVSPISNIKGDDLIKTQEGFHKALIGVYLDLTSSSLYGGDLTLSVLDVLAQNYTTPIEQAKHPYEKYAKYEYTNIKVESRFDAIWNNLYNAVAGCNSVFEDLDPKKEMFSPHLYEIIRGELLGVRAMLHFDALRMYAPAPKYGLDIKAIPYVEYFGEKKAPFLTSREAVQYILRDLKAARELLKENDPIVAAINMENIEQYLENRQSRMNYYTVTALLARVYLWVGNYELAYKYAEEVYKSGKFYLVTDKDLEDIEKYEKTLTFRDEHIMSIYVDQLQKNVTKELFDKGYVGTVLAVSDNNLDKIYSPTDLRYNNWFTGISDGHMGIKKYKYGPYIPIIKLSEILLILAESSETVEKSAEYLNELRAKRGLPKVTLTVLNIEDNLIEEYQREFIGEGVMFYAYKRFDKKILPNNVIIKESKDVYNLPIPKSELEFAQ